MSRCGEITHRRRYRDERLWFLQAQFEDGTTFVVQAPGSFTQEQVVQLAESVTYNP